MKHTRWLSQMTSLTLILLLLAACASPAPTATSTPVPPVEVKELTVNFERGNCIYNEPKVIRQGEVTITLNNLTDSTVSLSVGKLENGKNWQDLVGVFSEKNEGVAHPDWFLVVSHRPVMGDYRAEIFDFEPGSYAITCLEVLQGSWAVWLASPLEVR